MADIAKIFTGAGIVGYANAITYGNNVFYVGGSLTSYKGTAYSNMFAMCPNGYKYTGFTNHGFSDYIAPNTGSWGIEIFAIAIDNNDKIYVGGRFGKYDNVTRYSLVRLNTDGSLDTSFNCTGLTINSLDNPPWVETISIDENNRVLCSGTFNRRDKINTGAAVSENICILNEDGSTYTGFTTTSKPTWCISTYDNNGKIYYGGNLTFGKLNADGSPDTGFTSAVFAGGSEARIRSLYYDSDTDKIYVGGNFTQYGGNGQAGIVRLNSDGTEDTNFDAGIGFNGTDFINNGLHSIILCNNKIYVGGNFNSYSGNSVSQGIISLNTDGTINTIFSGGTGFSAANKSPLGMQCFNDKIYAVGTFATYKSVTNNDIIGIDYSGNSLSVSRDIYIPTGLIATTITKTTVELTWINNETTYIDNNIIQLYSGSTWVDMATISSGTTGYTVTGLIPNTEYIFRVVIEYGVIEGDLPVCKYYPSTSVTTQTDSGVYASVSGTNATYYDGNDGTITFYDIVSSTGTTNFEFSIDSGVTWQTGATFTDLTADTYVCVIRDADNISNFEVLDTIILTEPTALSGGTIAANQTICYGGNPAAFTSVADATGGITGYTYQWQYATSSGGSWNDIAFATNTTYDSGTLTVSRWFRRRVIDNESTPQTGYSNTLEVTVYPALYAGEIAANQSINSGQIPALLTSTHNASGASGSYVYQWQYSTNGIAYFNCVGGTSTTYQPAALTVDTYYRRRVYDTVCGIAYAEYTAPLLINVIEYVTPFCDGTNYYVSGSTCGNADGIIGIVNLDYFYQYDFTLTDIDGNSYTFNTTTGEATGLSANFYFLTASVKPAYWSVYGRDECTFEWIRIEDSDNTAFLNFVSVKPAQCLSFDVQYGRIYYDVSGLTSGHTYSFYAFTSDFSLYYTATGLTATTQFILSDVPAQCYWIKIVDEVSGCVLLFDKKCITAISPFSLSGIKKMWIAPWSDDIDYNYWKDSDDDYFLEFADNSFFTSTKIKEYLSLTGGTTGITWYSLPVAHKYVQLSQKLVKVRQGFLFQDTLTVAITKANADKWTKIANIINPENKWIYVVFDTNNYYWTGGYYHGASISAYSFLTGKRGEDDGYRLTIACESENKLLTNLDEDYVKTYIE